MSRIGLDVGTSRVKAVRFDDAGAEADTSGEQTVVLAGADGRREQDMDDVWAAAVRVLAEVAGRSPDPVDVVAVTAQGDGCWLVDADGAPVGNALLWNDNRAAPLAAAWHRDGTLARAFAVSGSLGAPGLANAQLRWLREHEPDRLARADRLLSCGSWVYSRLTGRRVLDATEAANPFADARTTAYAEELLDLFDLRDEGRLLPEQTSGSSSVGALTDEAATALGLPAGTPVVLAPYDVPATAIGAGAAAPGTAFGVLGTTLCVGVVREDPHLDREPSGITLPHGPGRWLVAYPTLTGTEALDWAARLLDRPDAGAVVQLASTSSRPDVPLFLPYLSPAGERSPFLDPDVRGQLRGLELSHTPADVARAVVEGLTLAVLDCLEAAGMPDALALSGGGARSDFWCRMVADAAGVPVTRARRSELGAFGAVAYAGVATGEHPDLTSAVAAYADPGETVEPQPASTQRLRERYAALLDARG